MRGRAEDRIRRLARSLTPSTYRRFEEAITALQDAAAIFRETGDRHSEGVALANLEAARPRSSRARSRGCTGNNCMKPSESELGIRTPRVRQTS